MNKSDFFQHLIVYSRQEGYLFYLSDEKLSEPQNFSTAKQVCLKLVMGLGMTLIGHPGIGFLMAQNTANCSAENKESLISDLQKIHNHCDFVGIKFIMGSPILRLGIDADNISDEALIGRFAVIHERGHDFVKYNPSLLRSRFGDGKQGVITEGVVVFSNHKRAKEFIQSFAKKCNLHSFWKGVQTLPWIADLEDEEITRFRVGGASLLGPKIFKADFFQKNINRV